MYELKFVFSVSFFFLLVISYVVVPLQFLYYLTNNILLYSVTFILTQERHFMKL